MDHGSSQNLVSVYTLFFTKPNMDVEVGGLGGKNLKGGGDDAPPILLIVTAA